MATAAELFVRIGADITELQREMAEIKGEMAELEQTLSSAGRSFQQFGDTAQQTTNLVNQETRKASDQFRQAFLDMAESSHTFEGTTQQFIGQLQKMGAEQKKLADTMTNENNKIRASFFETVAQMEAKSTQSEKIAGYLQKMNAPLTQLDGLFLGASQKLEEFANRTTAASMALRELGPTASMKDLIATTQQINQGFTRFEMVAIAAGIATVGMVAGLIKLSNLLNGELIPLSEQFKTTWLVALHPLADAFTAFAGVIIKAGTAIGEFFAEMAVHTPTLSAMVTGFVALLPAITLILSPLAIGISRMGSFAAAIGYVIRMFKPLIVGLGTVLGPAVLVTGAIVSIVGAFNKMWEESERLRNTVTQAWAAIKQAISQALAPLKPAFDALSQAFENLVSAFTGGETTVNGVWQKIGDVVADAVYTITKTLLPVINAGFEAFAKVAEVTMGIAAAAFEAIAAWWRDNGPEVMQFASKVAETIVEAWASVIQFAGEVWPKIAEIVQAAWELIVEVVTNVGAFALIIRNWDEIWDVAQKVWPYIKDIIVDTWNTIKDAITSALAIIENTIELFTSVLQGDWEQAWYHLKEIVANALSLAWDIIQLWGVGKILKLFKGIGDDLMAAAGQAWQKIVQIFREAGQSLADDVSNVFGGIKTFFSNTWTNILSFFANLGKNLVTTAGNIFKAIWDTAANWLGSLAQSAVTWGKNIMVGLWNGLSAMASKVVDYFVNLAKSLINVFKSLFKIGSPSQVMAAMGGDIVDGLVQGLEASGYALTDTGKRLIEGFTSTVENSIKQVDALGSAIMSGLREKAQQERDLALESINKQLEDVRAAIQSRIKEYDLEYRERIRVLDAETAATLKAIDSQIKEVQRGTDANIANYQKEMVERIRSVDEGAAARLEAIQKEIDGINDQTELERKANEQRAFDTRMAELEKQKAAATSAEERARIVEQINTETNRREQQLAAEAKAARIEALREEAGKVRESANEQKEIIRDQFDAKKTQATAAKDQAIQQLRAEADSTKETSAGKKDAYKLDYEAKKASAQDQLKAVETNLGYERDKAQKNYETRSSDEQVFADARKMIMDNNQQDIIALLKAYNPNWQNAGQSLGESMVYGLNSQNQPMEAAVSGQVGQVDIAKAAAQDLQETVTRAQDHQLALSQGLIKATAEVEGHSAKAGKAKLSPNEQQIAEVRKNVAAMEADIKAGNAGSLADTAAFGDNMFSEFFDMNTEVSKEVEALKGTQESKWNEMTGGISETVGTWVEGVKQKYHDLDVALTQSVLGMADSIAKAWDDMLAKAAEIVQGIYDTVSGKWSETKTNTEQTWQATKDWLGKLWTDTNTAASTNFEAIRKTIFDKWGETKKNTDETWNNITDWLSKNWSTLKQTGTDTFTQFSTGLAGIWAGVDKNTNSVWTTLSGWLLNNYKGIKEHGTNWFSGLGTAIKGVWSSTDTDSRSLWQKLASWILNTYKGIKEHGTNWFNGLQTAITGAWNTISSKTGSIWDGIKTKISGVWSGIGTTVKDGINKVIDLINGFIKKINSLKVTIPKVSIPGGGSIGGGSVSFPKVPTIPRLARGGWVDRPTLAMIGEGREGEIVAPESKLIEAFKRGMEQFRGGKGGPQIHFEQHITVNASKEDLQRYTERALRKVVLQWR